MSKILTEREKEKRKNNSHYFKNGKPKKSSMFCRNNSYMKEIIKTNGWYNSAWVCGGLRCPLYATGCDNKGRDWE